MTSTSTDVEAAPPSNLRHRSARKERDNAQQVVSRAFAGRIGGNQEFTISPTDSNYSTIIAKNPDAAPIFTWRNSFDFSAFTTLDLYKEATIEGVGTCLQVFVTGLYAIGLGQQTSLGPVAAVAVASVANALLISLFIFGGGPVSGGHFNPLITMATFAARLAAFPRVVLYIVAQCTGAVVAGFLIRASYGGSGSVKFVPGCTIDTMLVTAAEAYTLETMTAFTLLFIAFGVGLDPRQKGVFGPALSPILVGIALGVCSFASGVARPGYTGASLNPARCLGLLTAGAKFEYHYVHWAGPITASILNGIMYRVIPIYKCAG